MIYGHRSRAPTDETAVRRAVERASGSWGGYQAWHQLDPETRLEVVEKALGSAANDFCDELPLAL
jgi:hypothetical protein